MYSYFNNYNTNYNRGWWQQAFGGYFFVSLTFFLALFCLWFLCGTHDRNSRLDCGSTTSTTPLREETLTMWSAWLECPFDPPTPLTSSITILGIVEGGGDRPLVVVWSIFCGFYVALGEIQDESWESGCRRQSLVDNYDHKNQCFINHDTKRGWRWWHYTFGCSSFLSSSTFFSCNYYVASRANSKAKAWKKDCRRQMLLGKL